MPCKAGVCLRWCFLFGACVLEDHPTIKTSLYWNALQIWRTKKSILLKQNQIQVSNRSESVDKHVSKSTLTSKHEKSAKRLNQTKHDNQIIKQQNNGTETEKKTNADIKTKIERKTKIGRKTKMHISAKAIQTNV